MGSISSKEVAQLVKVLAQGVKGGDSGGKPTEAARTPQGATKQATTKGNQQASTAGQLTPKEVEKMRQHQRAEANKETLQRVQKQVLQQAQVEVKEQAKAEEAQAVLRAAADAAEVTRLEVAAKAEEAQAGLRAAANATEVTRLEVAAKAAEAAKVEVTRAEADKARLRAAEKQASRLEVAVATAMQAWDATIAAMVELKAPGIVAEAALTAMRMTAGTWGFDAPEAVEAVMLKIVSQTPLSFINPHLWLLLSIIRGSSPDHQVQDELASMIWKAVKTARVAQTGS